MYENGVQGLLFGDDFVISSDFFTPLFANGITDSEFAISLLNVAFARPHNFGGCL